VVPGPSRATARGNGKKYFLHLLTEEQLQQRGMSHRKTHW
jgi:hypothetical protein